MNNGYPYDAIVDGGDVYINPAKLAKAEQRFLAQQANGKFPGGQMVVRRHGKCVLRLSCGLARGWQGRGGDTEIPVTDNTPFAVYSTGKPMAAIVIALLEAQGLLDIHAPIATILPKFAGMGRDAISTYDVLTHRGGIILKELIHKNINGDRDAVWQLLLDTPPRYPRGTFAYMPCEYGSILDQLCLRLTGHTIAEHFQTTLTQPLGLNNISYGLGQHKLDQLAWAYWQGKDKYVVAEMDVAADFERKNNSNEVFQAGNPAFSMVADASNLAAFYDFLVNGGKSHDGQQLIPQDLIQRYTQHEVSGWNKSVRAYLSMSRGFMLGTVTPSFYGWWGTSKCYGHPGMFSSVAFADPKRRLSIAIVTNGNKGMGDFFQRTAPLAHTLRHACR